MCRFSAKITGSRRHERKGHTYLGLQNRFGAVLVLVTSSDHPLEPLSDTSTPFVHALLSARKEGIGFCMYKLFRQQNTATINKQIKHYYLLEIMSLSITLIYIN